VILLKNDKVIDFLTWVFADFLALKIFNMFYCLLFVHIVCNVVLTFWINNLNLDLRTVTCGHIWLLCLLLIWC